MKRHTKISEDELVAMLERRSSRSIGILYDNYSAALYGVILRIVQREEVAEDVLQETFVKIWNNFSQYNAGKGRLFTWMVNVARNLAIDKVRSKEFSNESKNQGIDNAVSFVDASLRSSFNPDTIGLKEIVQKLEKDYKEIINLLFFGGYTQVEAAEKLNIPLGTVKTRSRAALMKLREQFEKLRTS